MSDKDAFVRAAQQQLNNGFKRLVNQIELDLWKNNIEEKRMKEFIKQCEDALKEKK